MWKKETKNKHLRGVCMWSLSTSHCTQREIWEGEPIWEDGPTLTLLCLSQSHARWRCSQLGAVAGSTLRLCFYCDAPTHRILQCLKSLHGVKKKKKKLDKTRKKNALRSVKYTETTLDSGSSWLVAPREYHIPNLSLCSSLSTHLQLLWDRILHQFWHSQAHVM